MIALFPAAGLAVTFEITTPVPRRFTGLWRIVLVTEMLICEKASREG